MSGYFQYLGFWTPGPLEIILILAVLVLVFGRRLPDIARSLGKSLSEFKKGVHEAEETKDELKRDVKEIKDEAVNEAKDAAGINDLDKND